MSEPKIKVPDEFRKFFNQKAISKRIAKSHDLAWKQNSSEHNGIRNDLIALAAQVLEEFESDNSDVL